MVHSIPWYIVLLVSIPEAFLSLSIGFKLFNVRVDNKSIFILAVLAGILSYYLRGLTLVFGIHTLIIAVFLIISSRVFIKTKISYLFICVIAGIIIAGIIQSLTIPPIINIMAIDVGDIANTPWLNFYLFIPVVLIMLLLSFTIKKHNFTLYDFKIEN